MLYAAVVGDKPCRLCVLLCGVRLWMTNGDPHFRVQVQRLSSDLDRLSRDKTDLSALEHYRQAFGNLLDAGFPCGHLTLLPACLHGMRDSHKSRLLLATVSSHVCCATQPAH